MCIEPCYDSRMMYGNYPRRKGQQMAKQTDALDFYASSKNNEWYTPPEYIEAARRVMGSIDLAPASCAKAQEIVNAERYYTVRDDGLSHSWYGNIFLNPPYGRYSGGGYSQDVWSDYLLKEYDAGRVNQAILLITNATDAKRFDRLFDFPVCLTNHRIKFLGSDGKPVSGNTKGSAFVYLSHLSHRVPIFIHHFAQFGNVVTRMVS